MLKLYQADLHIHSCLSPCGDLDMSPRRIVAAALQVPLDIIAVTDHNSSENIEATIRAAAHVPLVVMPGMEVTSAEEAHLIALFSDIRAIELFQQLVYDHLLPVPADQATIDEQVIVNENDEVEGFNPHLLLGATSLPFQQLVDQVHQLGGLAIASHVDRESFSIIGQLGFIPEGLALDALEISLFMSEDQAKELFPDARRFPLVKFSDAHYLKDIGRQKIGFLVKEPTLEELKLALQGKNGRKILRQG